MAQNNTNVRRGETLHVESRIFHSQSRIELLHSKNGARFVRSSRTTVFSWDVDILADGSVWRTVVEIESDEDVNIQEVVFRWSCTLSFFKEI